MERSPMDNETALREQIAETREQYERAVFVAKHLEKELREREKDFMQLRAERAVQEAVEADHE
jgi:exonuclease VII small subunit